MLDSSQPSYAPKVDRATQPLCFEALRRVFDVVGDSLNEQQEWANHAF